MLLHFKFSPNKKPLRLTEGLRIFLIIYLYYIAYPFSCAGSAQQQQTPKG
jgi:hypothetical protein